MPSPLRPYRRLLLALLVIVAFGASVPLLTAQTRCPGEIFYYSDAARTDLIGYESWGCNGCFYSSWGQTFSRYRDFYPLTCPGW